MDLGVKGRTFVLLGGSRGMGWEAARVLAGDGANVAIISRNPASAQANFDALAKETGVRVEGFAADAMEPGSVEDAIGRIIEEMGPLRGLAVTHFLASRSSPFVESTDEEWERFFQDVLMGTVRACRTIIPHLIEQGGGAIVLTSAYSARAPKPFLFPYASQKAALINFGKNHAKTFGPNDIRTNMVCPGAIQTERSTERLEALIAAEKLPRREAERKLLADTMKMNVALQRLGQPQELGEMMAFLLSDRAAYTNGLVANVDGGTDF